MNFATLKTEVIARVSEDITDTRAGQFVNWARAELDDMYLWPYRLTTASGAAPLTITDLGWIETVVDTANSSLELHPIDRRELVAGSNNLTTTGTPTYFYVDNGVVRTYPVGGTLNVRYYKVPPDLTGTDTPLAPTRFHELIVNMAVQRAYRDGDEHEAARALQGEIDRQLAVMANALLGGQHIGGASEFVQVTYASEDW